MSTAPRYTVTPTWPNASQGAEDLTAPSGKTNEWVHPDPASFSSPRLSHQPSPSNDPTHHPSLYNSTYSSPSFSSSDHSASGTYYQANHQGYGAAYASPNFTTQPVQTQVANGAYFPMSGYPYYGPPVGTAPPSHVPGSGYTQADHHAYPPQMVLPSQSSIQSGYFQRAEDQLHTAHQTAPHYALRSELTAKHEPRSNVQGQIATGAAEDGQEQSGEASCPSTVQPKKLKVHVCTNMEINACSGIGEICLNAVISLLQRYDVKCSDEELWTVIETVLTAQASNDDDQQAPSQTEATNLQAASPGLSSITTASTPTAVDSPSSDFVSGNFAATSEPGMASSSSGKGAESEDCCHPGKRRREESENADNDNLDGDEADDRETHPNKKRAVGGDFVCLICHIFKPEGDKTPPYTYSREDALKRHVKNMHAMFVELLRVKYKDLRILERRTVEERETEDLTKLVMLCIIEQIKARQRSVVISQGQDLTLRYPWVVELMGSCL